MWGEVSSYHTHLIFQPTYSSGSTFFNNYIFPLNNREVNKEKRVQSADEDFEREICTRFYK